MSRAFTREIDDVPEVEEPLPPRPRDPSPITAAGHAAFVARFAAHVDAGTTGTREARILKSILDTVVVKPSCVDGTDAGFGCAIVVEHEDGRRRRYVLVGPDEADPASGAISIGSPLGRALRGRSVGAEFVFEKPAGEDVLRVIAIAPMP